MTIRCAAFAGLTALAGCQQSATDNAVMSGNRTASSTDDYLARIAKLPPAQQQMVLFRAIRDAGQDCQDVTRTEKLADIDRRATWRVTCRGGGQWAVMIGADGVANVTGPPAQR